MITVVKLLIISMLITFGSQASRIPLPQWPETNPTKNQVKRQVLLLWSKSEYDQIYLAPTLRQIETILNYFGLQGDHWETSQKNYSSSKIKQASRRYRAIITCFGSEDLPEAGTISRIVTDFMNNGVPWISICQTGFFNNEVATKRLARPLARLGFNILDFSKDPIFAFIAKVEQPRYLEFERKLKHEYSEFPRIRIKDEWRDRVQSILHLHVAVGGHQSDPVFISQYFSMAYGNYGLYRSNFHGRRSWMIDPYQFFADALQIDRSQPVPEIAVLNGRRVFYSHIDGDAFWNVALDTRSKKLHQYCGRVMMDEIFRKYPKIPFGVSLIRAEVDPQLGGNQILVEDALEALRLPNVQAASHTTTHPLKWKAGEVAYEYSNVPYNHFNETVASIDYIADNLLPSKRPIRTLYWSGDCMPSEEPLAELAKRGFYNINGGDSQFDPHLPSLAYVAPLGRWVGKYYQAFASNSNDNIYTRGWEGPYYGFSQVIHTFKNTGTPFILRPINPYFHFFLAERTVGIDSLDQVLQWSLRQNVAMVFPDTYIESVHGWVNSVITRKSRDSHIIEQTTGLATLRVDDHKNQTPKLEANSGIMGYFVREERLYISIDPHHQGPITVQLQKKSSPSVPYLVSLGGKASDWKVDPQKITFQLGAFARPPLILAGIKKEKINITVRAVNHQVTVKNGTVEFQFEVSARPREVSVWY